MQSLPDDTIIIVCRYLTLSDILHLRLTNRRLAAVVVSCSKAIAPFVASNTFPNADLLLRRDASTAGTADFTWLKGLVPKYLAAVVVDRFRLRSSELCLEEFGIPAESEAGDALRERAEKGWRVLSELSLISQEVYRLPVRRVRLLPPKERLKRVFGSSRYPSAASKPLEILERRERMILEQRLLYLKRLDAQIISDYRFMYSLLLAAVRTNHDPPSAAIMGHNWTRKNDVALDRFDWSGDHGRRLHKGNSWVNWFIMHEGPTLFWKQWKGDMEENFVRDRVLHAWNGRLEQQIAIERDTVCDIENLLTAVSGFKVYCPMDVLGEFEEHARHRIARVRAGQPGPKETLEDVPYWIDFRG
ncbi:hypothetical protein H2201_000588 [Coniosporium apollinis]|uniref:F-box domain-containing protein n=2 Tax=Coniosporium TaxID=2810619 RepID=A0ABQ9P5I1_9PEZI|nr:hypothetical protein H2199_001143 [Cladosporium sp. JES 115]KAJ9669236.1 hypothetical protein H2201_000588 [Coniosporium apollinis]